MSEQHGENQTVRAAQAFLVIFNAALFAVFWYKFYNYQVFTHYSRPGYAVVLIVYVVAYFNLAFFHGAFKFGKRPFWRLVIANILTLGTTDVMIYIGGCLFKTGYMDVVPGLVMALIQIVGSTAAAALCERALKKKHPKV